MKYTLIVSCCYLMWGLGVQSYVMKQAQNSLPPSASSNILVQTTPFNILLWRVIALEGGTYKVGYLSLFDKNKTIQFMPYSRASDGLIEDVRDLPKFQRMAWFTKDFYKLEAIDNKIIISDLRMGLEPDNYIFAFQIATQEDGSISVITPVRHTSQKGINRLSNVWKRIWDENHSL